MQVQRCLMCQRIFEGEREYGREVGTLEDAKCYGARQGVGRRMMVDDDGVEFMEVSERDVVKVK